MPTSLQGDDKLIAVFKQHPVKNPLKTGEAGRPIYDDQEIVEIRAPGSRNVYAAPATAMSHWSGAEYGDDQVMVSYAERFSQQYRQFKMKEAQTKSGTPLSEVPFLTEARRAELRALNVYTAEQLASIDGQELKNIGMNGRDLKNRAQAYIDEAKANAPNLAAIAELESLKARNEILEEDMKALKAARENNADTTFDDMSLDQLRDLVTANTGHAPQGSLNRKTLERMARDTSKAPA